MTENFNSAPSSPESYDDEAVIKSELWHSPGSGPAGDHGASSREPNESTSAQAPKISASMQKRRRVTRACDECRRKKIKCDGKQPCTHCTVYSYGESLALCPGRPDMSVPVLMAWPRI